MKNTIQYYGEEHFFWSHGQWADPSPAQTVGNIEFGAGISDS